MKVSKIVLLVLKLLLEIVLESMKKEESNLDPDGCPLNAEEYDRLSWFRCQISQIITDYEKE